MKPQRTYGEIIRDEYILHEDVTLRDFKALFASQSKFHMQIVFSSVTCIQDGSDEDED